MFLSNQVANFFELDVSVMNAEDAATNTPEFLDCFVRDLVLMYIGA
jgi:hypothetical protein